MAVIFLIRHGQASFGTADYDELSPTGRRQSELLGAWLKRSAPPFDALFAGRLKRQRDTAEHLRHALGHAPPVQVLPAFDEYDHDGVIRAYLPAFAACLGPERPVSERELLASRKLFELGFRYMIRAWMHNEPHEHYGLEPWRDFCIRVGAGLRELIDSHAPHARIAVVTSGGTIAAALRAVLGLSNKRTLAMNWTLYNASVTQIYYGRSGQHHDALVLGLNNVAHLELAGGADLITFR
jgi:broad specificity phosphatase PhoE